MSSSERFIVFRSGDADKEEFLWRYVEWFDSLDDLSTGAETAILTGWGKRIGHLREEQELTRKQLAEMAGLDHGLLYFIEHGFVSAKEFESALGPLSKALGKDPSELKIVTLNVEDGEEFDPDHPKNCSHGQPTVREQIDYRTTINDYVFEVPGTWASICQHDSSEAYFNSDVLHQINREIFRILHPAQVALGELMGENV